MEPVCQLLFQPFFTGITDENWRLANIPIFLAIFAHKQAKRLANRPGATIVPPA